MIADTENPTSEGLPYGRYQIRKRLARGGMGEVFLADQMGPTGQAIRPVALKRMLPRMAKKPHAAQMFLEEMSTAAQLNHPNIATTYDFGEVDGTYFMAMEYLEGLSLHQVLSVLGAIPVPHAISIAMKILEALDHAHKRKTHSGLAAPVVHRDVSPHNIMISTSGNVKLLDFGIARAETEALGGRLEGKVAYAAPEQLRGDSVDRRSDLWAVGVLLYESLCGIRPYEFKEAHLMVEAARQGTYAALGALRPEAAPLEELIARSLKYEPSERWPDAETTLNALKQQSTQFPAVASEEMASLITAAGGPTKSVLGVENITSFGGTAVGDASNRTATLPFVEQSSEAKKAFHPDRLENLASVQGPRRKNATGLVLMSAGVIALILGFFLVRWTNHSANHQIKSVALPPTPVTPIKPAVQKPVPSTPKPKVIKAEVAQAKKPVKNRQSARGNRRKTIRKEEPKRQIKSKAAPQKAKPIRTEKPIVSSTPKASPVTIANNAPGRLSISSTPWAQIEVDGNALGATPKLNIKLSPGRHRLILTPGDGTSGERKIMNLTIKSEGHLRVIADFSKNTFRTLGN